MGNGLSYCLEVKVRVMYLGVILNYVFEKKNL